MLVFASFVEHFLSSFVGPRRATPGSSTLERLSDETLAALGLEKVRYLWWNRFKKSTSRRYRNGIEAKRVRYQRVVSFADGRPGGRAMERIIFKFVVLATTRAQYKQILQ